MLEQLKETVSYLQGRGITRPEVGIVLGTGLGKMIGKMNVTVRIPYVEIPHFPEATVEFHHGNLVYGEVAGRMVLAMQGRFHYYEGYTMQQVTFPVRVMKLLGVRTLLLSNASGSMNPAFGKGSLVVLDDHINLQPANPLVGRNYDELGPRFPDMSRPYDPALNGKLHELAGRLGIRLGEGVYAAVTGPNLETRAEYRYLRTIGADLVGMSTVPEVIVANHMGLPCAAVSVVTDACDPDNLQPVSLREIIQVAGTADAKLSDLFEALIGETGQKSEA
jgi:purine-nucleoside phosphorylase